MQPPAIVRRQVFRWGHRVLRIWWFFRRPAMHGVKCVLTDRDQVLLVRHTYGQTEWDLPGGGVKRDEPPLDAIRREMEEELGIRIEDWRPLGEILTNVYHRHDTLHCFHAELRSRELRIDHGELETAKWFPLRELPRERGRYVATIIARMMELDTAGTVS